MPRRSTRSASRRPLRKSEPSPSAPSRRWTVGVVALILALAGAMSLGAWFAISFRPEAPEQLRAKARDAARSENWDQALQTWLALDRIGEADAPSLLEEAEAAEALGRIDLAQSALKRACSLEPNRPQPWLARLEILRIEDRPIEAQALAWQAYEAVDPEARSAILRALTLSLLADVPPDLARKRLEQRRQADPLDLDALAALARRQSSESEPDDPPLPDQVAALKQALQTDPRHLGVREALVGDLAILGQPDAGRKVLDAWPQDQRDARYDRLRGRWDLEYDHRPEHAVESFQSALQTLPHDWKTHYRLARALYALGRTDASAQAAETVSRLREALEPTSLGRRLAQDLTHLDDLHSLEDLAQLCTSVGLTRLAEAWRDQAQWMNHP